MAKGTKRVEVPIKEPTTLWIGDCVGGLLWGYEKLQSSISILRLDSERQIKSFGSTMNPTYVVVGSHSRTSPYEQWMETVSTIWPDSKRLLILGEWWPGHRRTHSLNEEWDTNYWFQFWDRIYPTLKWLPLPSLGHSKLATRLKRLVEKSEIPTIDRTSRIALVTTNTPSDLALWQELLPTIGLLPIARLPGSEFPYGEIPIAVVDIATIYPSDASCTREITEVERIRLRLPNALIIARTHFPSLHHWHALEKAGADLLISGLFHLPGLVDSLHCIDVTAGCERSRLKKPEGLTYS